MVLNNDDHQIEIFKVVHISTFPDGEQNKKRAMSGSWLMVIV